MIWRLTYCNKEGVEARVDIIKGDRTSVEVVQGSGNPFTLSYKLDKSDKSGHIMTSSADIEIFETDTFNIDDLKTSNETELKVEYFEGDVLTWAGFILPDFFSKEIGSPSIVRMTASDRLTALKGVTLSDLQSRVSLKSLLERCLSETGLTLNLVSQIQINQGSTNILDSEVLSQRLTDTKGRSISCYDILMSIMVATNSTIRQRKGQWQVYNKLEHEQRTPTVFFDKVERGAIRTIQPVASSVGVYQEFGGGRLHPDNYDFSLGVAGWTSVNGFVATTDNREIELYSNGTPIYGDATSNDYLVNNNERVAGSLTLDTAPYLESASIPVVSTQSDMVDISVDVSITAPGGGASSSTPSFVRYAVIASNGTQTYALTRSGTFEVYNPTNLDHSQTIFIGSDVWGQIVAVSKSLLINGKLEADLTGFNVKIRIYGSGTYQTTAIHFASVRFSNTAELPKGNIFKTTQGANYTKLHDVETTIFGDYITTGLNGYFYNYTTDDTSSLHLPNGELSPPQWKTVFDTTERPLLHHISRQKSRLFSVAHDILKANINVESFDPLAVFQDCKGGKYVIVSASFDFLRSEVDVELEQIAEDEKILKRDFIYSYFGEGEDTIKSIGGIAGGGGGAGGGGMTSEQLEMLTNLADWWKLDEENDAIYSEKSVYSLKGVSALGLGSGGGGGGGDFSRLDAWADYTAPKAGWVLSALLGYDLHTRVNSLEAGGGGGDGGGSDYDRLDSWVDYNSTRSGWVLSAGLGYDLHTRVLSVSSSTSSLETRVTSLESQSGGGLTPEQLEQLTNLSDWWKLDENGNLYTEKNLYSTKGVSALGLGSDGGGGGGSDYDRLDAWADYDSSKSGWVLSALLGVDLNSALTTHTGNTTVHITANERTNWNLAYTNNHTHGNKSVIDALTQGHINVLNLLSVVDGNIKVDTTLWATGGISALGLGSGGGGGGDGSLVIWGAEANGGVGLTVEGITKTLALKSGLDLKQDKLIAGTGITIVGNTISSNGSGGSTVSWGTESNNYIPLTVEGVSKTVALQGHTHTIAQITGLQGALDSKATQSDIDTAIDGIEIGGRNYAYIDTNIWGRYIFISNDFPRNSNQQMSLSLWGNFEAFANVNPFHTIEFGGNTDSSFNNYTYTRKSVNHIVYEGGYVDLSLEDYEELTLSLYGMASDELITKAKIEIGNKATDWTPAPEDQISDWNETDVTSFSYIKNKPTQLSQFTDNIGVATHIANKANPHSVTKSQVGLGNVDNTSDANKPVSTAQAAAIASKIDANKFQVVAELPASPTAGVFYFVKE